MSRTMPPREILAMARDPLPRNLSVLRSIPFSIDRPIKIRHRFSGEIGEYLPSVKTEQRVRKLVPRWQAHTSRLMYRLSAKVGTRGAISDAESRDGTNPPSPAHRRDHRVDRPLRARRHDGAAHQPRGRRLLGHHPSF